MHPETKEIAKHMREFGLTILGRSAYHCTFSDMGAPFAHAMAVVHAAQGVELIIKARIVEEHPLLIFCDLPKSKTTTDLLSIKELFENGRTIQYSELPEVLWAATGIRIANVNEYRKFGRNRNTIVHFAVPNEDWSDITFKFLFQVVEPLVCEFWKESIISHIVEWDMDAVSDGYVEERLEACGIEITPDMRAAIDKG